MLNFRILNNKGKILDEEKYAACYSSISYGKIPDDAYAIESCFGKQISTKESKRWVAHLRKLGFPSTFNEKKDYPYRVLLKNYTSKGHLFSTLFLIRYLEESPDIIKCYFDLAKKFSKKDKFLLLQIAHTILRSRNGNYLQGSNHKVRLLSVLPLSKKEDVFKAFEKTRGLFDRDCGNREIGIHASWHLAADYEAIDKKDRGDVDYFDAIQNGNYKKVLEYYDI